jgi:hypothetical protein
VVGDEDVEVAEGRESVGDEGFAVFRRFQRLLDGKAEVGTSAGGGERVGLVGSLAIAEGDAGSGLAEEADRGRADAARAAGDERGAAGKRERDAGGGCGGFGMTSNLHRAGSRWFARKRRRRLRFGVGGECA